MSSLFSFEGRYSRSDWWRARIFSYFLNTATSLLWGVAVFKTITTTPGIEISSFLLWSVFKHASLKLQILLLITTTASIWIWLASMTKRYHDRGKSGIWALVYFIPFIGPMMAWMECGFASGTSGPNQYDEPIQNELDIISDEEELLQQEKPEIRTPILSEINHVDIPIKPKPLFGG